MTFGSFVGICLTLAFVLALVAVTLRLLRRFGGVPAGAPVVPLRVLQRVGLGPRQGIAIVRVGSRLLAVSVGDGGVRTLAEVSAEEAIPSVETPVLDERRDFKATLLAALRDARGGAVRAGAIIVFGAAVLTPVASRAQVPVRGQPGATPAVSPSRAAVPATQTPAPPSAHAPATVPAPATAAASTPAVAEALSNAAPQLDLRLAGPKGDANGLHLSGTVGVIVLMGMLTLLPTLLLLMTSFTRILVVLNFLRQAIGAQSPPAPLISALALLLTGFVMAPTLSEVNRTALTPWLDGRIDQGAMMTTAIVPFRTFMLRQTRQHDLAVFVEMSKQEPPKRAEDVPTTVLMSAFVTSELRTAFQIGFALFLPFIIIDVVVSSVLMSMGMMMLPPAMVSLPFKLLLFVLVDGWSLVVQGLVASFH